MSNLITPKEHVKDVCKIGQGHKCCRYLACGAKGFECLKHTSMRQLLDARGNSMTARADNCKGVYAFIDVEPTCVTQLQ